MASTILRGRLVVRLRTFAGRTAVASPLASISLPLTVTPDDTRRIRLADTYCYCCTNASLEHVIDDHRPCRSQAFAPIFFASSARADPSCAPWNPGGVGMKGVPVAAAADRCIMAPVPSALHHTIAGLRPRPGVRAA
jgi:hypothetical protein